MRTPEGMTVDRMFAHASLLSWSATVYLAINLHNITTILVGYLISVTIDSIGER